MTPEEMAQQCAECSSENVICLHGAARLISNAQAKQKRKDKEIARKYTDGLMPHTVEPFLDGQRAAAKGIADRIEAQEETP